MVRIFYITSGHKQPYPHKMIDQFISLSSLESYSHQLRYYQWSEDAAWQRSLLNEVKKYLPHYLFTIHGLNMNNDLIHKIKSYGTKVGVWFVDDPYDIDDNKERLYEYDFVFTNELECVPIYKKLGYTHVHYLSLGTHTGFYYPELPPAPYQADLTFVGSPFPKRVELLKFLHDRLPQLRMKVIGPFWDQYLPPKIDCVNYHIEPNEIRKFYNGAKINLNIHREYDENIIPGQNLNRERILANSPNNRLFDIAACKSFQLTDFRPGLVKYFDLENEMTVFNSEDDLVHKIRYYLEQAERRNLLANNAYYRTVNQHAFTHRLCEMARIVEVVILHEKWDLLFPDVFQEGKLMKGAQNPEVYFVYQGRKYLIPSVDVFNRLGCSWQNVTIVPDSHLELMPCGIIFE